MLEDALEFADLAEKFGKQNSTKQSKLENLQLYILLKPLIILITAALKKEKKNSVLDSRKSYNICKHHCCSLIEQSV